MRCLGALYDWALVYLADCLMSAFDPERTQSTQMEGRMKRICIALLFALLSLIASCSGPESLGSKAEYAALQGVEYEYRNRPISSPEIHMEQGYELLALPTNQGRTWIMLKAENEPYWKQLPQTEAFSIPKNLFDKLTEEGRVSSAVQEVLSSHVAK
jgi:hypothetical protein